MLADRGHERTKTYKVKNEKVGIQTSRAYSQCNKTEMARHIFVIDDDKLPKLDVRKAARTTAIKLK